MTEVQASRNSLATLTTFARATCHNNDATVEQFIGADGAAWFIDQTHDSGCRSLLACPVDSVCGEAIAEIYLGARLMMNAAEVNECYHTIRRAAVDKAMVIFYG